MIIEVVLNGTDTNPFHRLGLSQNPFPQVAKTEYASHLLHLAKLGAEPIVDTNQIRAHLAGWSQEFVDLCCANFRKGEMVRFRVTWKD